MANFSKELEGLLKTDIFSRLRRSNTLKIAELSAIMKVLISADIPFDLVFSPGTRREAAAIELSIYINPTTTIDFVITLEAGGSVFGST